MNTETLAALMVAQALKLATVESCTGGGIAARCTDLVGSSQWFNGGLVTYSNAMKIRLGVDPQLIEQHGAVSEHVVRQMAEQGRRYCNADWSVAVTGVAGPNGGSPAKPVGTVWFAWSGGSSIVTERQQFSGDRALVRAQTVNHAIDRLIALLSAQTAS
ncbi:MAG: CinA family protein [Reinekea sp.]|jgi:nicotinamide-nucleotide amidase